MSPEEVLAAFRKRKIVDEQDLPSGVQLDLLSQLASVYQRKGLVDRHPKPLWKCCEYAKDCWAHKWDLRPPADETAGVTLPWVGPDYRPGGVVVVAANVRWGARLLEEYEITCASAGEQSQLARLADGRRTAWRSPFGYRSTRSAAPLVDAAAGRSVRDRSEPAELVHILDTIARLQSVKCSPQDGGRGAPTREMAANCPPFLLAEELDVLQPKYLLTMGAVGYAAIRDMRSYRQDGYHGRLEWGTHASSAGDVAVFMIDHPVATRQWQQSHADLIEHLLSDSSQHRVVQPCSAEHVA